MNIPNNHPFQNPWAGCETVPNAASRLQTWMPRDDYNFIKLIRPRCGTVMITVNLMMKKLIDELRKRGITSIEQQSEFERFVAECEVTLVPTATAEFAKVAKKKGVKA